MGGMETHVAYLADALVDMGRSVGVVLPSAVEYDGVASRCRSSGAEVLRADTDARHGRMHQLLGWWTFVRWAGRRRPKVVHVHTGGATGGLGILAASRVFLAATVVRTEHDVPDDSASPRLRISSWLSDRCTHTLVAVSRRNASLRTARLGGPRHFGVVLNGVPVPPLEDIQRYRAEMRARIGVDDDTVVLGSVVRLAHGKGLDDLINAVALLPTRVRSHLVLVGDGPLRSDLERLVEELGLARTVTFAGHQDDPDPFFAAMDVFVLAVPRGSMSIALLEAMARGLPAVITFGGPEEAVIDGRTGLLAPPSDPVGLASVLGRLAADARLREQLAGDGREHILHNLSSDRVARDLGRVYERRGRAKLPSRLVWAGND